MWPSHNIRTLMNTKGSCSLQSRYMKIAEKFSFSFSCVLWGYGLSSFLVGDTKLERFLPTNEHTQKK